MNAVCMHVCIIQENDNNIVAQAQTAYVKYTVELSTGNT